MLGEQLLDRSVQKAVIDDLSRLWWLHDATKSLTVPTGEATNIIYNVTTDKSPIRRWLVDVYTCLNRPRLDVEFDPLFVVDVANALFVKTIERSRNFGMVKPENYYP